MEETTAYYDDNPEDLEDNSWTVPVEIYYTLLVIHYTIIYFGFLANLIVCIVIVCNKAMHTVTNCYLFSLSILDLLLLIDSINDLITALLYEEDTPSEAFNVLKGLTYLTSLFTYTSIITAFTVERFLAIFYPLRAYATSKISRTIKMIVILWLISLVCALPTRYMSYFCSKLEGKITLCESLITNASLIWDYVKMCLFFVLPFVVVPTLYILIAIKISKRGRALGEESNSTSDATQRNSLRIIGAIVLVLIICWTPLVLFTWFLHVDEDFIRAYFLNNENYDFLRLVLYFLFMLSPILNPIIYSIMSAKFRIAAKEVFGQCFKCCCACKALQGRRSVNTTERGLDLNAANIKTEKSLDKKTKSTTTTTTT